MPSSTVENYLKHLHAEQQKLGDEMVPVGRLASSLQVASGTATSMVKALADGGLVHYEPRGGVRLTPSGEQLALHVLRRHRLVERFLVEVLHLDWSEVHEEAEELEHAVSDKVMEKIDEVLGYPHVDPHGDPIPSAKGKLRSPASRSLSDCEVGTQLRVARVIDQDAAFLRFAQAHGLIPGTTLRVERRDRVADAVSVRPEGGETVTVGTPAAAKILVEKT